MAIGLDSFRQVGGGVFEREIRQNPQGQEGVRQSGLSRLAGRIQNWFRSPEDMQARHQERSQVKESFVNLLIKTEGQAGAQRALRSCGLPDNWVSNDRPLTNHQVEKILNKAQEYRLQVVRHNETLLNDTLQGLEGPELRDVRAAVTRAVRNDSRYGNTPLSRVDVQSLRTRAETELRDVRAQQCKERFPALTKLIQMAPPGSPLSRVELNPARLTQDLRQICGSVGRSDPQLVEMLNRLDQTTEVLGRQAWTQDSLQGLSGDLDQQRQSLTEGQAQMLDRFQDLREVEDEVRVELLDVEDQLSQNPDPDTRKQLQGQKDQLEGQLRMLSDKQDLCLALRKEMDRQTSLLDAKSTYIDTMRLTDPLTDRSVKHSNLVWAEAGQYLLNQVAEDVRTGELVLTVEQQNVLEQVWNQWDQVCLDCSQAYRDSENVDTLQTIEAPSGSNKDTHPIVQGKRDMLQDLRTRLEGVGIPRDALDALFSKTSLARSERLALSGLDTWQPLRREMPVMRDGVMRTYTSEIVPAQFINHSLGVDLGNGHTGGVSAGVKDSDDHARNLKVSRLLDPDGQVMTTVVGHGVLDMWGIEDENLRQQSNKDGAREVLEVALTSNDRMRRVLTDPDRPQDAPPPKLVHVSVNLISPDTMRDFFGVKDYQERTYTRNQFRAFEENSGPNQSLRVFDPDHPGQQGQVRDVDVDTITFSFGINGIATSGLQNFMGVWHNVHEHNTANMIKLVGDLGDGQFGARGVRPGGFVGEVYDRLEAVVNDPGTPPGQFAKARSLMAQLRGQTDLVRGMFTEKTFREGKGDTAKMGREVLVLQGLAEQGLDLVGATDLAGTMSKGCKSDKDRGGVTDVELKSKLILRDLGGEMNPDEQLQGDDQGVYYTVSSSSGQLENQRWNTGLSGSKEAGHLKDRLPDPEVRQFLCGLGQFAKA
ncbi:inositol phosphate phosphatase SopB [Castellaniella hirudinis]|uniref:Inositol phosphate phosphatase SopB n=1 Tax=Castellaniella hirudinis TaxID=1144617 RepID=A0ABV8RX01_9BURK